MLIPCFGQGIRATLEAQRDMLVVGEAADGQSAVNEASASTPDLMLIDVALPIMNGLEVLRSIKHIQPRTGVIIITDQEDEEDLLSRHQARRGGLLPQGRGSRRPDRRRSACEPGRVPDQRQRAGAAVAGRPVLKSSASGRGEPAARLFVRRGPEVKVLDYIAEGNSNKEMARSSKSADQTVKNHITSILRKLAVDNRRPVVYALRKG